MRTELLDYELPEELIALHPPAERDGGRLLVLDGYRIEHRRVRDWPELVPEGALVVVNDTRVFRARLVGRREPSGGRAELLLLRKLEGDRWIALGRPMKRLRPGTRIVAGEIELAVIERRDGDELLLRAPENLEHALERSGHVPLPPYIRRPDEPSDALRYQTVYAAHTGSVAAPTAGLHLTQALLSRLAERRIDVANLTLHVGPGTFKPVTADDLDQHEMHAEELTIGSDLVTRIDQARQRNAPVIAVGTTVVRALESARDPEKPGHVRCFAGETRLLIQPGYRFSVVDGLLTNFHMPKSTLLALVAAFAGLEPMQAAYRSAIAERYRFLSYGDAMWIPESKMPAP
jgi:S-adenosylmethionine:tRNA ribosyltransferase-isomerase